jgi:hypothetical protein
MKKLLKLNHWQIFLLIYGIPLLMLTLFVLFKVHVSPTIKNISMVVYIYYMLVVFSWPLAIGLEFVKRLPFNVSLSKRNFILHFVIMCIVAFILAISQWIYTEWLTTYVVIFIVLMCYYLVSVFIVVRFASKVFASFELGREAKASEYVGYLFAFWFVFMGVWFVQPKIRKLINQTPVAP